MMGEAAIATAGMKVNDVNDLLDVLVRGYSKHFSKAPQGKRFQDCYNVKKILPSKEYLDVYDDAKKSLVEIGLPIR